MWQNKEEKEEIGEAQELKGVEDLGKRVRKMKKEIEKNDLGDL